MQRKWLNPTQNQRRSPRLPQLRAIVSANPLSKDYLNPMYTEETIPDSIVDIYDATREPSKCSECPFWVPSDRSPVGYCPVFDQKTTPHEPAANLCNLQFWNHVESTAPAHHTMQEVWGAQKQVFSKPWIAPPSNLPKHEERRLATPWYGDCSWAK